MGADSKNLFSWWAEQKSIQLQKKTSYKKKIMFRLLVWFPFMEWNAITSCGIEVILCIICNKSHFFTLLKWYRMLKTAEHSFSSSRILWFYLDSKFVDLSKLLIVFRSKISSNLLVHPVLHKQNLFTIICLPSDMKCSINAAYIFPRRLNPEILEGLLGSGCLPIFYPQKLATKDIYHC